jgi:alpha-L-fucosidase 2
MDPIWAARLGLGDEAGALAVRHAKTFNRFRYGGWDSHNSSVFPDGLSVVPYLDGAGVSAFAVNEMLLQSHNGLVRVLPAVPKTWSGIFQLRAEGGFLVAADFQAGRPCFVELRSLLGKPCRVANPWPDACIVRNGTPTVQRSSERTIAFKTTPGATYVLEPADAPLSTYRAAPIEDKPKQTPGLLGRDAAP